MKTCIEKKKLQVQTEKKGIINNDMTLKYTEKNIVILIKLYFVKNRLAIDKMSHKCRNIIL